MRYLVGEEVKEAEGYVNIAAEYAKKSTCNKSKRGAIIVKAGEIMGVGYNKVTMDRLCTPCIRENIKDNSKVELCSAIHAEQVAILDALEKGNMLKGARMYHIEVKDEMKRPSGKPSCTVCSRIILESGISEFVLLHKEGFVLYSAEELNNLSFAYFLSN